MSLVRNLFTTFVGYEARRHTSGHGLRNFGLGMFAARIATLIAKKLYDDAKEAEALPASEAVIDIEGHPVTPESSDRLAKRQ